MSRLRCRTDIVVSFRRRRRRSHIHRTGRNIDWSRRRWRRRRRSHIYRLWCYIDCRRRWRRRGKDGKYIPNQPYNGCRQMESAVITVVVFSMASARRRRTGGQRGCCQADGRCRAYCQNFLCFHDCVPFIFACVSVIKSSNNSATCLLRRLSVACSLKSLSVIKGLKIKLFGFLYR